MCIPEDTASVEDVEYMRYGLDSAVELINQASGLGVLGLKCARVVAVRVWDACET